MVELMLSYRNFRIVIRVQSLRDETTMSRSLSKVQFSFNNVMNSIFRVIIFFSISWFVKVKTIHVGELTEKCYALNSDVNLNAGMYENACYVATRANESSQLSNMPTEFFRCQQVGDLTNGHLPWVNLQECDFVAVLLCHTDFHKRHS